MIIHNYIFALHLHIFQKDLAAKRPGLAEAVRLFFRVYKVNFVMII